ncbi:hypothetical protein G6F46_014494 [Rhizopus delemar]|nr:hypothetical protein G6F46_014494 [Rhizopus delemar]
MMLLTACNAVHVVRSNQAKTYAGLTIPGERRMEIVPVGSSHGHFQTVTLAPVLLMPEVAETLSPGVGERLKAADHLCEGGLCWPEHCHIGSDRAGEQGAAFP